MMKRNNGGYALPFVLVVMVIICLVGVSILSFSLSNLQSQKASIERMQEQYKAEGEIEKVMSAVKGNKSVSKNILGTLLVGDIAFSEGVAGEKDMLKFLLATSDQETSVQIKCEIQIEGSISDDEKEELNITLYKFDETATVKYLSYEILNVEEVS